MFTLTIETNNAAFERISGDYLHRSVCARETEIARLLRETAAKLEGGHDCGVLMDYNGNRVGKFALTE